MWPFRCQLRLVAACPPHKPVKESKISFASGWSYKWWTVWSWKDRHNFERTNQKTIQLAICRTLSMSLKRNLAPYSHVSSSGACHGYHDFQRSYEDDLTRTCFSRRNWTMQPNHQFHQIEGLVVGKNISIADLQEHQLIVQCLVEERQIRLRPSYFPFTEPSVEVDVSCFKCGGQGSFNVSKSWLDWCWNESFCLVFIEIVALIGHFTLVLPFQLGQERVAVALRINDIRGFYQGDISVLRTI